MGLYKLPGKKLRGGHMSKNIRQELRSAIFESFKEGSSKKAAEDRESKIFSFGTKFVLLDRVNDFVKSLPKEVRRIDQLKVDHVINYLDNKSQTCTQATVDEYRSELKKLGKIIGVDLSCPRIYANRSHSSERGARSVIAKEDFFKILDYAKEHPSRSGVCLQLEALIGVRVSDMCYGIKIEPDRLCIQSKNGKMCYRTITPEIREIIHSDTFKKMIKDGKVYGPKDNSINKYLSRLEDRLGMEKRSFHDIRRRIAQDKYDEYRNNGFSRTESLSLVSSWLNHGPGRERMVLQSYISNDW